VAQLSTRWIAIASGCALGWSALAPDSARADVWAPGDVLVADLSSGLVRIEPTSNRRTVLDAGLEPWFLDFDPDGDLVVLEIDGELKRVDRETGAVTPIRSGSSGFEGLEGVAVAPDGFIYIVDRRSLWKVDPTSGELSLAFGQVHCLVHCSEVTLSGLAISAAGEVFVTAQFRGAPVGHLLALDVQAQTHRFVVPRFSTALKTPFGVVEDADHALLVADRASVIRVDPTTGAHSVVSQGGKLLLPYDLDVSGNGKIHLSELESAGFIVGGSQVVEIDRSTGVQRILARPVSVRGIAVAPGIPAPPACSDGRDNDGDRRADSRDRGCSSPIDGTEKVPCADGIDNDGDGLVDHPEDPGCGGKQPRHQEAPQCSDLRDNDGDGLYDDPEDPECLGPDDNTEHYSLP
jgi:DNA-binding beta-propeller fold protein YncE